MPSLGLLFQAWKSVLFASFRFSSCCNNDSVFSVLRHGVVLTPKMSRQQAARSCIKFQLLSIPNRLHTCPTWKPVRRLKLTFISVWKWLCICIFFFTALEVKRWHSEIRQLPKYSFFIWTWVAGAPRTTSRRFSPVAGAYGDHWKPYNLEANM